MGRNTSVNAITATSSNPPVNPPQTGRSIQEGNAVEKDNIQNSHRIPAATGTWPYSALQRQNGPQQNDKVPTKVSGGFAHSIRAPPLFKDKYPFAFRPAFQEQQPSGRQLPNDLTPPRVGHD